MSLRQSHAVRWGLMALSNLLPNRPVRRRVQGVELLLPRRHPLPFYAFDGSPYGQNLVALADLLAPAREGLTMLDVGANIGDSAVQVLDAVGGGHVVCVEPDERWLWYLERNVGRFTETWIEPSLLLPEGESATLKAVRYKAGTTRFEHSPERSDASALTPTQLKERYPVLQNVRLIKSDTDGYDVSLVPALATVFAASRPVLFFEYDPRLTSEAAPHENPAAVWGRIAAEGYSYVAVWDNRGLRLGSAPIDALPDLSKALESRSSGEYWDVAAAHRDDAPGLAALRSLAPSGLGETLAARATGA